MSTQTDPRIVKIVDGMVAAGVVRTQAVAVATAIEHALRCEDFVIYYGTFMHNELSDFVDVVYTT